MTEPGQSVSIALESPIGDTWNYEIGRAELKGSVLSEAIDSINGEGDVFIAPTFPIELPSGTILDGIIKVIP